MTHPQFCTFSARDASSLKRSCGRTKKKETTKMKKIILTILAIALTPLLTGAQQTAPPETNPVSNAVRKSLERNSKNMVAGAEEMPADKYGFHPTPDQMTFAHLVMHMTGSNNFLCAQISGTPAPADQKLSETDSKDKLVAALKGSLDYCAQALAKVDDSHLGDQVQFFGGRTTSRAGAMIALASTFADHYGAEAIYLRLNGLLPPTAQPKKD
jgi:DinB superfamily